jgi:hypothetical protein
MDIIAKTKDSLRPKKRSLPRILSPKPEKKSSIRWMRSQKAPPSYASVAERQVFLGSSVSKSTMDGSIGEVRSFNCNSPAFKRFPQKSVLDASLSQKRKRESADQMEGLLDSMKKLQTEDEATKRLLLVVHYMNQQPTPREMIVNSNSGLVTFGKFL